MVSSRKSQTNHGDNKLEHGWRDYSSSSLETMVARLGKGNVTSNLLIFWHRWELEQYDITTCGLVAGRFGSSICRIFTCWKSYGCLRICRIFICRIFYAHR